MNKFFDSQRHAVRFSLVIAALVIWAVCVYVFGPMAVLLPILAFLGVILVVIVLTAAYETTSDKKCTRDRGPL